MCDAATYVYDDTGTTLGAECDYRARYYYPQTGRFLSEDPRVRRISRGGHPSDPSPDAYLYVQDNPVNWFDPTGLVRWKCRVAMLSVKQGGGLSASCDSDCINNQSLHINVQGLGAGAGLGASATYSEVFLYDDRPSLDVTSLMGKWHYIGAGFAVGAFGVSYSGLTLGRAKGPLQFDYEGGFDLSVGVQDGVLVPTWWTSNKCGCQSQ